MWSQITAGKCNASWTEYQEDTEGAEDASGLGGLGAKSSSADPGRYCSLCSVLPGLGLCPSRFRCPGQASTLRSRVIAKMRERPNDYIKFCPRLQVEGNPRFFRAGMSSLRQYDNSAHATSMT